MGTSMDCLSYTSNSFLFGRQLWSFLNWGKAGFGVQGTTRTGKKRQMVPNVIPGATGYWPLCQDRLSMLLEEREMSVDSLFKWCCLLRRAVFVLLPVVLCMGWYVWTSWKDWFRWHGSDTWSVSSGERIVCEDWGLFTESLFGSWKAKRLSLSVFKMVWGSFCLLGRNVFLLWVKVAGNRKSSLTCLLRLTIGRGQVEAPLESSLETVYKGLPVF